MSIERVASLIRDVPDFPKPGIVFKDITPLLADPAGFRATTDWMAERVNEAGADSILAIESRGFIFGAAVSHATGVPLQLVRKRGKLPRQVIAEEYTLEYGVDQVEVHTDAVEQGKRYLLIDDVIATGGTAGAVVRLVEKQQASIAACVFLMELGFLDGRAALGNHPVHAMLRF